MSPYHQLCDLTENLSFESETDSEWKVFSKPWPSPENILRDEDVRELAQINGLIEGTAIADFFTNDLLKADSRYIKIKDIFDNELKDSVVYKVGEVQCVYVIVGRLDDLLIGISAKAVET